MGRQVLIPLQWQSKTNGQSALNFDVDSHYEAAVELIKLGIPFVVANGFTGGKSRPDAKFNGTDWVLRKVAADRKNELYRGLPEGSLSEAPNIGGGDDSDISNEERSAKDAGYTPDSFVEARQFLPGTFTSSEKMEDAGSGVEGFGGASNAGGLFRSKDLNPTSGPSAWVPGKSTSGFGAGGRADGLPALPQGYNPGGGETSLSSSGLDIDQIISLFTPGGRFGNAITVDELGVETLNPLLASLLDQADAQGGRVSDAEIQNSINTTQVSVAEFNKQAVIQSAKLRGDSDEEVARLATDADKAIAEAQQATDEYIADQQLTGTQAQADATAAAAESARLGVEAASKDARIADQFVASSGLAGQRAAAGAASPFGFMNQGGDEADLASIYNELNEVGLAQAGAANIGAQDNAFSFAAGQAVNPVTGELQFNPNQIAQIGANTPAAFAARGQEAAARAGATGFGALLSGDAVQQANANAILRAQAANNAYGSAQLGQDQSRIDQILRGGLSAEQRLAEINASQSGQNFANQLNFMSNPSAVGFATEQGLFGGGNNQILQDINNSPEGNVPGSLFGFNSPSAGGAGGNQTTNTGNFNANTLRNASDEQIGFLQGAASAGGQTPSEFNQQVESFTPQGY